MKEVKGDSYLKDLVSWLSIPTWSQVGVSAATVCVRVGTVKPN